MRLADNIRVQLRIQPVPRKRSSKPEAVQETWVSVLRTKVLPSQRALV